MTEAKRRANIKRIQAPQRRYHAMGRCCCHALQAGYKRCRKIGYTVLGAVIMLVGISVGSIIHPPLNAQRDGSFDEVRFQFTVLDEKRQVAIRLPALKTKSRKEVFDVDLSKVTEGFSQQRGMMKLLGRNE